MLNKIIQFSIKNKLLVGLLVIGLIVYGSYQITKLPIDAVPDITDNQVQILTISSSMGATDVERLVTIPVEQVTSNIAGLKQTRSFSRFGLSVITLVFEDNVDIFWARQQVAERLVQIQSEIPLGIEMPYMAPITTGLGEIYQYVVKTKPGYEDQYSLSDLRTIQDWTIRKQMLGTKGVADVSSFGGKLKQYEISINPDKLKSHNVTISEIIQALESNNENTGGSYIEKGAGVLYIRSEGLIENIDEIGNIVVKHTQDKIPVKINDVATVRIGSAIRYGALCYNDEGEVAGGVVMMLKGANSSDVIVNVKRKIAEIQNTLPEGVIIEPFLDRSKMVNNAISTVEKNLLEGAIIVIFVLVIFLGNLRAGFIVASVIPLSMLFTIIMMNFFGVSGNLMSLGAIDFGLIVDGAVIIVEAVLHGLSHSKKNANVSKISTLEMDEQVRNASSRMMNAAVFGQIIILIVYLPILSLQGIEGKMFKPMALTVAFAIIGAFLLSLTYVPMMSALFLSKKIKHKQNLIDRCMDKIEKAYIFLLTRTIKQTKWILISIIGLLIGAIFLASTLGGEFIPQLEEGDFAVETRLIPGSSLNTTIDVTQKSAKILLDNFPEVEKVVTKIGSGEIPTDPMPIEAADLMIILKDKSEWTSAKTFTELAAKMNEKLSEIPGISYGFQYPVQMRFNELMTGAKQDVVCKIFGEDLDSMAFYANKLSEIINTVEGATDLYVETVTGVPEIVISYKRNMLEQYGLDIKEMNNIVNTAFAGKKSGLIYEGEKKFDMVIRMDESKRKDIHEIEELLINTPMGTIIPLRQVADVKEVDGPNQIQRENTKRRIIVGFNVRGRDVQSIVNELKKKVEVSLKLPSNYELKYGGSFENLQQAKGRLAMAVPISLLLIFLLLYFAFNSLKTGILIYTAIPLSAIGGIIALWLRDMPFSISAGIGFIALFGVAVLNGIVLISEFKRLAHSGMTDIKKIIIEGSKNRLRPVLMTAAVASLGFIPMAISNGAGAEVQKPLATVVIGGLISATFLTLFMLPSIYLLANKKRRIKTKTSVVSILFILFASSSMFAQNSTTVDLNTAIKIGLENHLLIQSQLESIEISKKQEKSSFNPDKLIVNGSYGNINSYELDNSFSVGLTLQFPSVYILQGKVFKQSTLVAVENKKMAELELAAQIKYWYYRILLLTKKAELLSSADSIYTNFLDRVNYKLQVGETNLLEKSMAEIQKMQIDLQSEANYYEIQMAKDKFNFYLGNLQKYEPKVLDIKYPEPQLSDTNAASYPKLKAAELNVTRQKLNWKKEKSVLLPGLNLNYYNMTIIGWQKVDNIDTYFGPSTRFSNFTVGIHLPLFFWGQSATIKSSKLMYKKSMTDFALAKFEYNAELNIALNDLEKQNKIVEHYEQTGLEQAKILVNNANNQYNQGNIGYLEWAYLINQSIQLNNDYLDAINNYNNSIIQFELLTPKTN